MKKHEAFYIGVGLGYMLDKWDIIHGLAGWIIERKRLEEIERARVVDVFGDEIK